MAERTFDQLVLNCKEYALDHMLGGKASFGDIVHYICMVTATWSDNRHQVEVRALKEKIRELEQTLTDQKAM